MGMRQPTRLQGPVYGLPEETVSEEHSRIPSAVLPLVILFALLAAAALWYVALPAFAHPVRAERSCEVIVLETGATKCVRDPARHHPRAAHA